ncbi:MAG: hypothetical protein OEZ34_14960, partial [Spirochaetia bacterium]|nr:hypothetical protein [Spirochaetia bacterium]
MKRFSGITISIILLTSYCVKAERPAYSINSAPGILASVVMSFIGTGTTYTIGGTISGLTGSGLVLTNNNGDNLTVASGATSFVFPTAIADGSVYNVQVLTYPTGPVEVCAASNNANTVSGGNVSNVSITCVPGFNIGGTLSGLLSATNIVLQNNAGDDITVSANGSFTFPTPLPNSAAYNVTVLTQPSNTRCFVSAGSGTVAADVTTIVI